MTLEDYLRDSGLTQTDLAKAARLSQSTVSRVVSGKRKLSTEAAREIIRAMAEAYALGHTALVPMRLEDLPVEG